jgi:hypothetical protein
MADVQPWWRVSDDDGRLTFRDGAWRLQGHWGFCQLHGRDPLREARQLVDEALAARPDAGLLVVVGLGLGYLLDALDERQWTGRILAVEPDAQVVRQWLARRDWRAWLTTGRLRVLIGPDYHGVSECRALVGDGVGEPAWLTSPAAARTYPDTPARAAGIVERLRFDARANARARREHGARYLLNTLRNVEVIRRAADVDRLADLARGIPAIVVGAGPSLDAVLPVLREARQRAAIVAVDTALRPLLRAGIEPHLVVAVDPGEANVRHLVDLPACPRVHLVGEGSVDRQAWSAFEGRAFAFTVADHHPWPWLRAAGIRRGRLRAWGSVLTCAFDMACRLGADPIVFVGSDLAFSNGRPYARGVSYEEDWRRLAEWGVPLDEQWATQLAAWPVVEQPDLDGAPVRTAPHLVAFRGWLVEQAERMDRRTVVNASESGILHGPGIERRSLERLLEEWPVQRNLDHRLREACRADAPAGAALPPPAAATISAWTAFADGITPERLARALAEAPAPHTVPVPAVEAPCGATPAFDAEWMTPLARETRLVRMTLARWQMESATPTVRRYRCRTSAGRVAACALQMPDGAVAEDGVPLQRAAWIDAVGPGQYFIWRDEVFFASTDGTDPRENGREYTVVIPSFVAFLESLSGDEILRRGL